MAESNPLEVLLEHNHWATRQILDALAKLTFEQFHQKFEIGRGNLHDTTTHILGAMRNWTYMLKGEEPPPRLETGGRALLASYWCCYRTSPRNSTRLSMRIRSMKSSPRFAAANRIRLRVVRCSRTLLPTGCITEHNLSICCATLASRRCLRVPCWSGRRRSMRLLQNQGDEIRAEGCRLGGFRFLFGLGDHRFNHFHGNLAIKGFEGKAAGGIPKDNFGGDGGFSESFTVQPKSHETTLSIFNSQSPKTLMAKLCFHTVDHNESAVEFVPSYAITVPIRHSVIRHSGLIRGFWFRHSEFPAIPSSASGT